MALSISLFGLFEQTNIQKNYNRNVKHQAIVRFETCQRKLIEL